MRNFRIALATLLVLSASGPAFAQKPVYVGTDWKDVVSKVQCKDIKHLSDGQMQLSADISVGGKTLADPIVPSADADALKKKCPVCQHPGSLAMMGVGC